MTTREKFKRRFRPRPSPATVIGSLALVVALGGTSMAAVKVAIPNGSVGNPQLKTAAVTSNKIQNGTLLKVDVKAGQVTAGAAGPAGPAGPAGSAGAAGAAGGPGPIGPSDAYSQFVNGPVVVPTSPTTLASLSIPQAGKYVVFSKAVFTGPGLATVLCGLSAPPDGDLSATVASATPLMTENTLVHEFASSGSVAFACEASAAGVTAAFVRVTAIKVSSLINTG